MLKKLIFWDKHLFNKSNLLTMHFIFPIDEDFVLTHCFQNDKYISENFLKLQKIDLNCLIILLIDNNNYKNKNIQNNLIILFNLFKKKQIKINLKELKQLFQIIQKNNGISYCLDMEESFPEIKLIKRFIFRKKAFGF
jgi:hypothetical protein